MSSLDLECEPPKLLRGATSLGFDEAHSGDERRRRRRRRRGRGGRGRRRRKRFRREPVERHRFEIRIRNTLAIMVDEFFQRTFSPVVDSRLRCCRMQVGLDGPAARTFSGFRRDARATSGTRNKDGGTPTAFRDLGLFLFREGKRDVSEDRLARELEINCRRKFLRTRGAQCDVIGSGNWTTARVRLRRGRRPMAKARGPNVGGKFEYRGSAKSAAFRFDRTTDENRRYWIGRKVVVREECMELSASEVNTENAAFSKKCL